MSNGAAHVSPALAHLRFGVAVCATALVLCAIVKVLVFGFVHYTEKRTLDVEPSPAVQPLVVEQPRTTQEAADLARRAVERQAQTPVPMPVQLSAWDPVLRGLTDAAVTVGIIAASTMAVLMLLGVAIAAGGAVPGIDRVVQATVWAVVLAWACMPWRDVFASTPFPGVFAGYEAVVRASEEADAGRLSFLSLLATHVLMPLIAVMITVVVSLRFRAGVAAGVIATSVNDLERVLEREMSELRRRGVSTTGPRTVGALNRALGDRAATPAPAPAPRTERAATTGGGRGWISERDRPPAADDEGEPRRPI